MLKTTIILGASVLLLIAALLPRNAARDSARAPQVTLPALPAVGSESSAPSAEPRPMKWRAVEPASQTATPGVELVGVIESESDPDRRSEALERTAESVSNAELPGLLDSLARLESTAAAKSRAVLIRRWAERDGPAAAAWAEQLGREPTYQEALTQVALGWAGTDLSGALDWVQTLPAGGQRESVTLGLGYETARTDAVKALEVAASLEPNPRRDDLIEHAISQWATTDFATAVRWAEQDRVAVAVVQRWVQNEPELAASWVQQFPETPVRETTARNLVAFWAAQDREAAANWLQALPEGSLRTVGMAAYAQVEASATGHTATE